MWMESEIVSIQINFLVRSTNRQFCTVYASFAAFEMANCQNMMLNVQSVRFSNANAINDEFRYFKMFWTLSNATKADFVLYLQ